MTFAFNGYLSANICPRPSEGSKSDNPPSSSPSPLPPTRKYSLLSKCKLTFDDDSGVGTEAAEIEGGEGGPSLPPGGPLRLAGHAARVLAPLEASGPGGVLGSKAGEVEA